MRLRVALSSLLVGGAAAFSPSLPARAYVRSTHLCETPGDDFAGAAATIADAAASLRGRTVVVKYGGNAMTSAELKAGFCQDVAALQKLGVRVVVVHGGGPQINAMLETVGVESRFEGGMRVSSREVVDVAEMGEIPRSCARGVAMENRALPGFVFFGSS